VAREFQNLLVKLVEREVASQRDVADVDREALDCKPSAKFGQIGPVPI
jgi:hypothetical protein